MFFILSKVLYYVLMPIAWVLFFLFLALLLRNPAQKKKSLIAAIGLLLIFTNPFLSNEVLLKWEVPATPIHQLPDYELAVVLTGVTHVNRPPHDRVHFSRGADRILHPLQLYKLGKVKKILISGGSGSILNQGKREADQLRKVLLLAGVPDEDIIIENQSRNTRENAQFTAAELKKRGMANQKVLLVTSAFHMRRSAGCFARENVNFDTFSVDFLSVDRAQYTPEKFFVPQEIYLYHWYVVFHELLGYFVYRLVGYI